MAVGQKRDSLVVVDNTTIEQYERSQHSEIGRQVVVYPFMITHDELNLHTIERSVERKEIR